MSKRTRRIAQLELDLRAMRGERDRFFYAWEKAADDLHHFQEGLTRALNKHGVPAMPSWEAAIDYLATRGDQDTSGRPI